MLYIYNNHDIPAFSGSPKKVSMEIYDLVSMNYPIPPEKVISSLNEIEENVYPIFQSEMKFSDNSRIISHDLWEDGSNLVTSQYEYEYDISSLPKKRILRPRPEPFINPLAGPESQRGIKMEKWFQDIFKNGNLTKILTSYTDSTPDTEKRFFYDNNNNLTEVHNYIDVLNNNKKIRHKYLYKNENPLITEFIYQDDELRWTYLYHYVKSKGLEKVNIYFDNVLYQTVHIINDKEGNWVLEYKVRDFECVNPDDGMVKLCTEITKRTIEYY